MLDALKQIAPERADVHVEMANEWMYGRRSKDLDFGVRVEGRLWNSEEPRARARTAFLTRILSGIQYELAHPPKLKDAQ